MSKPKGKRNPARQLQQRQAMQQQQQGQQLSVDFDTTVRHLSEKLTEEVADAARWHGVAESALQRAIAAEAQLAQFLEEAEADDEDVASEEADGPDN